ncbi:MAG: DUF3619 family protein, partial [Nitrosospira sp.]|nr:DUF3619 family protein [Nitrosospira sp.]
KIIKNPLFWSGTKNQVSSIMLLSDELPVDAYLDDEFGEWFDHSWQ